MSEYHDTDGNPMSLYRLVRKEPDWAVSRIDFMTKRIAELEKDLAFYRCCALSGETPDDLCKPSSIALQEKELRKVSDVGN